jgi:hypothetical protein
VNAPAAYRAHLSSAGPGSGAQQTNGNDVSNSNTTNSYAEWYHKAGDML